MAAEVIRGLRNKVPGRNSRTAQGLAAANDIRLQQTIKQIPPSAAGAAAPAQQVGAQQAAAQGQQAVAQAQQASGQSQQLSGLLAGEQKLANQAELAGRQLGARQEGLADRESLARLSEQAANEILDSRLDFVRGEMDREYLNQRTLADWALTKARSEEEFADYAQASEQATQRKLQVLDTAAKMLRQEMEREYRLGNQEAAQELELEMIALEKKFKREQDEAKNRAALWQAAGTVLGGTAGAVAGGMVAGPAGAASGASAGGGLGGALGSLGNSTFN